VGTDRYSIPKPAPDVAGGGASPLRQTKVRRNVRGLPATETGEDRTKRSSPQRPAARLFDMRRSQRRCSALLLVSVWLALGCGSPNAGADAGSPSLDAGPSAGDASVGDAGSIARDGGSGECAPASGAFQISSVIGAIEEGGRVVVCGDLFGDVGPSIAIFDDMENDGTAARGAWLEAPSLYAEGASRSGARAMRLADADLTGGEGVSAQVGITEASGRFGLRSFDEVFLHLSIRDLGDFPGNDSSPTTFSSDSSAKDVWMMFGDRGDNYTYSCSRGECNGNDIVFATHTGRGSFKIDGNTTGTNWWLPEFWQFEEWNTMSTYIRIDRTAPYEASTGVFEHVSASGGYVRDTYSENIVRELDGLTPEWDRLKIGAWYRTAGDVRRIADDLYVAIGPGAAARVEVANAARIEDATSLAVSTVDEWSAQRIAATLRLGDLDPTTDLFLFVVTADGTRSSGFPLAR
jgi:hypothetical protein